MERKLWDRLSVIVTDVARRDAGSPGVVHADRWIVLVPLWAALHDRSTTWATRTESWPADLRPVELPSQSTMSRRWRTPQVRGLLAAVEAELRPDPTTDLVKLIDAQPLPVGGASRDPEAAWGRGVRGPAKGDKLFALWGRAALPLAWRVGPMARPEPTAAPNRIGHLHGGGYLLGDKLDDSNRLDDLAARHGHQLVAAAQRSGAGLGHRRHSPYRLRARELLRSPFGRALYAGRGAIERDFGQLCSFGGGRGPLPRWVRRKHRVRLWVQAKLIIHAVRDLIHQELVA